MSLTPGITEPPPWLAEAERWCSREYLRRLARRRGLAGIGIVVEHMLPFDPYVAYTDPRRL